MVCSYVLWPLAFLVGVNVPDCRKVAELIGMSIFMSTIIAYKQQTVFASNRRAFASHVADNGTWYWSGDDVVLRTMGLEDIILTNGIITVYRIQLTSPTLFQFRSTIYHLVLVLFLSLHKKIWNSLHPHILQSQAISSFRRHLKTHYFQLTYPAQLRPSPMRRYSSEILALYASLTYLLPYLLRMCEKGVPGYLEDGN